MRIEYLPYSLFKKLPLTRENHSGYFLFFSWLCTSFVLSGYSPFMGSYIPSGNLFREYMVCGGQILFQGIVATAINRRKALSYLGEMMTVSLGGAFLLLPVCFLNLLVAIPAEVNIPCFLLVAGLMLLEHVRRVRALGLNKLLSFSWVLYRVLVLIIILK